MSRSLDDRNCPEAIRKMAKLNGLPGVYMRERARSLFLALRS